MIKKLKWFIIANVLFSFFSWHACSIKKPVKIGELYQGQWELITLGDKQISRDPSQKKLYISFDRQNCIVGFSGCNKILGSAYVSEQNLSIVLDAPTRLCPEEEMKIEKLLLDGLRQTDSFLITRDRLVLYGNGQFIAVFQNSYLSK